MFIADGIIVGRDGLVGEVDTTIAFCHLHGALTFHDTLLRGCLTIGFAVLGGSIEILTDGIKLIAFFHSLISPATDDQCGGDGYYEYGEASSHIILITI